MDVKDLIICFDKIKKHIPNADCWIDKEGKEREFNLETWELAEITVGNIQKELIKQLKNGVDEVENDIYK